MLEYFFLFFIILLNIYIITHSIDSYRVLGENKSMFYSNLVLAILSILVCILVGLISNTAVLSYPLSVGSMIFTLICSLNLYLIQYYFFKSVNDYYYIVLFISATLIYTLLVSMIQIYVVPYHLILILNSLLSFVLLLFVQFIFDDVNLRLKSSELKSLLILVISILFICVSFAYYICVI